MLTKMKFGNVLGATGLFIACILGCGSLQAQPAFLRRDFSVAGHFGRFEIQVPTGQITTGDFNGDGRPDLVVGSLDGISVLLNTGGGNFGSPIRTDYKPCGPLVAADFDGDGKLDLVSGRPCDFTGHILLGRGDGTFLPPREVVGLGRAIAGDFNNDGKMDLVFNDARTTSLRILVGNGDGSFRPAATIQQGPSQAVQLAVADFNRDGKPDVAAMFYESRERTVSIFLGRGDGTFQSPVSAPAGDNTLLVADLNGDGLPDLVNGFDVLLGKGDGSFESPRPYYTARDGDLPAPFAAMDFDGDGRVDLAVGSRYVSAARNQVLVFRGKGDGTMLPPTGYAVGWDPYVGAAADLDGDGQPDLATANLSSNTVSLLLSRGGGDSRLIRAVSAASGSAVVAPGSLATLYTSTAATGVGQAGAPPWPTRLGGLSLQVRDRSGAARLAPLLYVSGTQINFQVPESSALGEATLEIVRDTGSEQAGTIQVNAVAPGLFLVTDNKLTPAAFNVRVESNGSQTSRPIFECAGQNPCVPVQLSRSAAGSYLTFYGTGFHNATTANVRCYVYGQELAVQYAGPQGTPGLDQINVRLSGGEFDFWETVESIRNAEVVVSIDGVLANRALLTFSEQP